MCLIGQDTDCGFPATAEPEVAVVLSAYNGERFLEQQLDSILAQDYDRIRVYARSDGSTDRTLDILANYAQHDSIELLQGENLGVTGSFYACVQTVPRDIPYIAFSDQDDVWHSDRIRRAVDRLSVMDPRVPALYYSERNYCDAELKNSTPSHLNRQGNSFVLSLYDNVCPGNTIVMNRALADLFLQTDPRDIYYHDWWLELLATCFGFVIYDPEPTVEYRRLAESVSPSGKRGLSLLAYRIKEYLAGRKTRAVSQQLFHFLERFSAEMSEQERDMLQIFVSGSRMKKLFFPKRLRQTFGGEVQLRLCFLLGFL